MEVLEAIDAGDAAIIVGHHTGRGRASGILLDRTGANPYEVRSGRIVRVEFYATREEALASRGLELGRGHLTLASWQLSCFVVAMHPQGRPVPADGPRRR